MAKHTAENSESKKDQNKYATQKQIASLLKCTEFEIKKFVRIGLPKAGNNKYVPAECISWYIDYLNYWKDRRTITEIATMLGVTERWVNKLVVEKGIPKEKHGTYRLDTTITGYVSYLKEQIKKAEEGESSLNDERKRLIKMTADSKELQLQEQQKKLIPVELAGKLLSDFSGIVNKKLDMIEGFALNKLFACRNKEETLKVLKETKHHIKTEIAKSQHSLNDTTAKK